jgi:3-hydroxyisobutyrate dehydrogenase-like beta-hydroxyacid dehydrogenase
MSDKGRIGWIGLGKMGLPMAKNLIHAGYSLVVYNRTREKTKEPADLGAQIADTPKSLAHDVPVIISMVLDDLAVEAVSTGPEGALEGAKAGTVYVEMSTVSAMASARVAEKASKKDIAYLRAPVTGGVMHAQEGTLGILISGPREAYEQCREIFSILGHTSFYLGAGEEGRIMKLVLNMQVGIIAAMTAEALTFGELGGLDWNQMIDIIRESIVASPMIKYKAPFLKDRKFIPAFTASQMAKDFDLVMDTGRAVNAPMPITAAVRQHLGIMNARGKGKQDFWELLTLLEQLGGLKP